MKGFSPDPSNFSESYFNRPAAKFDVNNGFIFEPGDTRMVRIINGTVVIETDSADLVRVEGDLSQRPSFWTRRSMIG